MKRVLSLLMWAWFGLLSAQEKGGVSGQVIDAQSQQGLAGVWVRVLNTPMAARTDSEGQFRLAELPAGKWMLAFKGDRYRERVIEIQTEEGQWLQLGAIYLDFDLSTERELALITLTEDDLADDSSGSESTAALLQATRDVFLQAAAFNFGQARFRIRGLDSEYATVLINGISMNKIHDGRPQWNNWGGLNDATRMQEYTLGTADSDYHFGGPLGTQQINTRASDFRSGTRVSLSGAASNYNWRVMGIHTEPMNPRGWAFVVSGSRRWAEEGFFEGTSYESFSAFTSIEKRLNDAHSLNFTGIWARNERGRQSPNTAEVTRLKGYRYNAYWGNQEGRQRNSRGRTIEEPIFMLQHYWKTGRNSRVQNSLAYQTGHVGNGRLDFNYTPNPDPTYYRNLPSYYTSLHTNVNGVATWTPDYEQAEWARERFIADGQINWAQLYQANQNSSTGESVYVLYDDRIEDTQWTAHSLINTELSPNISLQAAVQYRHLQSEQFQQLTDLMGGGYFRDIDPFFSGSQSQPNLNNPNRVVGEGDRYGYHFRLNAQSAEAFSQFRIKEKSFDAYLGQSYSFNRYQREGLFRNGIYPDFSEGKSEAVRFDAFGFKGGMTYKINGHHYVSINGLRSQRAPNLRTTFPNVRLNNLVTPGLQTENISSVDISYLWRTPHIKARFTAYHIHIQNASRINFFYAEGIGISTPQGELASGTGNAFVAEIVTGMNRLHQGIELGVDYKLTSTLRTTAVAAIGQHLYNNNPNVKLNIDFLGQMVDYGSSRMKNYRLPGTPQQAYSLGLEYRDPRFWWIGSNINLIAEQYIDISGVLRTDNFFNQDRVPIDNQPLTDIDMDLARSFLRQERFEPFFLLNVVGGKSWRISKKNRNTMGFFAAINNVLDTVFRTGGFEQGRNANYREVLQDHAGGTRAFGPRYFYGFGRNYFVNCYVNF